MQRHLPFMMKTALVAVALAIAPASSRAQQQHSPSRPAPTARPLQSQPKPKNGQITLRNATSDSVRVELRIGDAANCHKNPVASVQLVPPGRSWLIAAIHPICWRRATAGARSGSTAEWMPWHRRVLAVGERRESTL